MLQKYCLLKNTTLSKRKNLIDQLHLVLFAEHQLKLKEMRVIKRENNKFIGRLNIAKNSKMDSLKLINFLVKIENKYKVKISTAELSIKKNQTVNKIIQIIHKKIKRK